MKNTTMRTFFTAVAAAVSILSVSAQDVIKVGEFASLTGKEATFGLGAYRLELHA